MKKSSTFYTLLLTFFAATLAVAQIPNESPFPVDVFVTDASGNQSPIAYVSTSDFGDTLQETLTAQLALAMDDGMYDTDGDGTPDESIPNEACSWETVQDNVAGKIAVIRRGACFFSQKIYNAQQAGAVGAIICNVSDRDAVSGMAGGDSADVAVIPSIFVDFNECERIYSALEAGEEISGTFQVSFSYSPYGPTTYATPLSQARPLENIEFTIFNPSPEDAIAGATGSAEVSLPDGTTQALEDVTIEEIPALTEGTFVFAPFTPTMEGDYTITYTNSANDDVLSRSFSISQHTFQADNGNIIETPAGTIEPSDEGFVEDGLVYDIGTFFTTGPDGGTATHASFMISNPEELRTGDADSDLFTVILYDTDGNGDGAVDFSSSATSYDDLRPVAFNSYVISEDHQPFDLITLAFEDPVTLRPDNQYLLSVQYNGVNAGNGIPPKYAYAGNDTYIINFAEGPTLGSEIVFTDQLYTGGWGGGEYNFVLRLHLEGFATGTVEVLDATKIAVAPNPTTDFVNVDLNLTETADEVVVRLFNMDGKSISVGTYKNVLNRNIKVDLNNLPAGSYFLSVQTPEGFASQKVMKF